MNTIDDLNNREMQMYEAGIELVTRIYRIKESAFVNDVGKVKKMFIRLLQEYQIEDDFIMKSESILLGLAIVDTWLSERGFKEKKALLNVFGITMMGVKFDGSYGAYSKKIQNRSRRNKSRSIELDPRVEKGNTHTQYTQSLMEESITNNVNTQYTERCKQIVDDWSSGSILKTVRSKYSINSKQDEKPFEIIVLNSPADKMIEKYGAHCLTIYKPNRTLVLLSENRWRFDIEHEYAHTQGGGLVVGYRGLLFNGLVEALTEMSVSNPRFYHYERRFTNNLIAEHPEYKELMYRAEKGIANAKTDFFSKVLGNYGLQGLLVLARMHDVVGGNSLFHSLEDYFFIEPVYAGKQLDKISYKYKSI